METYLTAAIVILILIILGLNACILRSSKIASFLILFFTWTLCAFITEAYDLNSMVTTQKVPKVPISQKYYK